MSDIPTRSSTDIFFSEPPKLVRHHKNTMAQSTAHATAANITSFREQLLADLSDQNKRLINALPHKNIEFVVLPVRRAHQLRSNATSGDPIGNVMMRIGDIQERKEKKPLWALLFRSRGYPKKLPFVYFFVESPTKRGLNKIEIKTVHNLSPTFRPEVCFVAKRIKTLSDLIKFYFFKAGYVVPWEVDIEECGRTYSAHLMKAVREYKPQEVLQREPRQSVSGPPANSRFEPPIHHPEPQRHEPSASQSPASDLAKWQSLLERSKALRDEKDYIWEQVIEAEKQEEASRARITSLQADLNHEKAALQTVRGKMAKLRNHDNFLTEQQARNKGEKRKLRDSFSKEMRAVYALASEEARQAEEEEDETPLVKRKKVGSTRV
ncbi:hypothetical protein DM02DRAFT_726764 [Periconia macrospinosa]|uniref:Uncharacterized protein n=1 Tax=Periconia macrospinosa TaxID=97972 RepID=A0A2V1DY61_9PLEO|nr:hypothetical protein DM02DRAFT_726764 [Periconia macrospinosa]